MTNVVFLGLGFGGLYTLRHFMERAPDDVRITAIDRRDRFVFTPLLYEYLAGELKDDVVAPAYSELIPDSDRLERVRAEVTRLDVRARELELHNGRVVPFDHLVVSPGSTPAFHNVSGAEEHALPFYSHEHAIELKRMLRKRKWARGREPAVVVGGGVVGIELAFALAERLARQGKPPEETRVVVLEAMDEILRGMSDEVRSAVWKKLDRKAIDVRTGVRVKAVDEGGVQFMQGDTERRIEVPIVAWAAGIRPSPLLDQIPGERHGSHGVRVERTLQLPAFPYVFVLGDAISYPGRVEGNPLPDTAQAAVQQSEVCAKNLAYWLGDRLAREQYDFDMLGNFIRVSTREAVGEVRGVVLDGRAAAIARRAAYLVRLPAWAIRTSAVKQWLGG